MRVRQRGAVVVIRSQTVAVDALGPKLTEEVSGGDSGDDPMTRDFCFLSWPSAHAAWRITQRLAEVRITGNSVWPVHSIPEDRRRAPEHHRRHPMRIE